MKLSEIPEDTAPTPGAGLGRQKLSQVGSDTQEEQPSALGALFRGFLHGVGNVGVEAAKMLAASSPGRMMVQRPQLGAAVADFQAKRAQEHAQQPYVQAHPAMARGGELGGELAATTLVPGGWASRAETIPGRIAGSAVAGAAGGALAPTEGQDYWAEKAKQVALGGGGGTAVGAIGAGIVGAAGAALGPEAQKAIAAYPIIGRLVSGAEGRTVENFNKAAVAQSLEPLGVAVPKNLKPGAGLIDFARDKYIDAYNSLLPKLSLAHDPQLTQDLQALRTGATDMGDDDLRQFLRNLENRFGENDKRLQAGLDGQQIKEIEGKLRQLSVDAGRQNKPALAENLHAARESFMDAVERQNPAEAAELKKINSGFALFARVEGAAASAEKRGTSIFSPQDLRNASWRSDKSARGNFARGADLMQGVANAGDLALNRGQWTPGNVSRVVMPLIGAAVGYFGHGGAFGTAAGAGAGTALRSALPAAVNAMRAAPMAGPVARGAAGVVGVAAGPAGRGSATQVKPADRMKAQRKVSEIQRDLYTAKRRGDLATAQELQGKLADADAEYRKLRAPA